MRNLSMVYNRHITKKFPKEVSMEETEHDWRKEWVGMPEFNQKDKQPVQKIVVNFETHEDVQEFAKLTGYTLTNKSKTIWFPYKAKECKTDRAYVNAE